MVNSQRHNRHFIVALVTHAQLFSLDVGSFVVPNFEANTLQGLIGLSHPLSLSLLTFLLFRSLLVLLHSLLSDALVLPIQESH